MLERYFEQRGVAMLQTAGGGLVPSHFGDPAAEHLATRARCGLFDFSFMGCWELAGSESLAFLQQIQTRNLRGLVPGALAYTLLCRDDGSILNDATVWCMAPGHYRLFTGNRHDVTHLIARCNGRELTLRELSPGLAVLALQGPSSKALLAVVAQDDAIARLGYFRFCASRVAGVETVVGRLGYSGESGYEILVPADEAVRLWCHLLEAGQHLPLKECGFEAANSLRIESGYILFSQELCMPVTPWALRMGRFVDMWHGEFVGREALRSVRHRGGERLVGLRLQSQHGSPASLVAARPTSQAWSPVFNARLGLGFVDEAFAFPGTRVALPKGGSAVIQRLPFYDPARRLPRLG